MDNWNLRRFRNDLSRFIGLIENHGVLGDFQELNNLLNNLDNNTYVNYNVQNIIFEVDKCFRGKRNAPKEIHYCKVYLDNKLYQSHSTSLEDDPIHEYSLDISIDAYEKKRYANNPKKCYKSCWHLDQEYKAEASNRLTHPSYHFQFGGKKMVGLDTGMVAVLGSPRIPHPPMDVFLGFHFVLLNFFDKKVFPFVNTLVEDYDYQQIIKRAQARLYRPYFDSYIPNNVHNDFVLEKIFPLYIH